MYARAVRTVPPRSRMVSTSASASRVLPMPASPVTAATRPGPAGPTGWRRPAGRSHRRARPAAQRRGGNRRRCRSRPGGSAGVRVVTAGGSVTCSRVPDRLVPRGRRRERRHAELPIEDRDARPVLAQAPRPGRRTGQQVHESDVPGLVERIEVQATRGGSDGARAGRRPPRAPLASRSRTLITVRSMATARAARQSSKSALSRRLNPARNGPRARAAAAASERRASERARRSSSATSTRTPSGASATRARSTMTVSPVAARSVDRVRRSALPAADWSASGQSSVASSSRANARPSAASSARIATALRVSTTSGAPSTRISGGPRSRMSSRGVPLWWSRRNGTHSGRRFRNVPVTATRRTCRHVPHPCCMIGPG